MGCGSVTTNVPREIKSLWKLVHVDVWIVCDWSKPPFAVQILLYDCFVLANKIDVFHKIEVKFEEQFWKKNPCYFKMPWYLKIYLLFSIMSSVQVLKTTNTFKKLWKLLAL